MLRRRATGTARATPWHLLALFLLLAWLAPLQAAQPLALSASEQAYLQAHPAITLCADPDWWPFEQIDPRGQHVGIAADLIALAAQRSGVNLRLHRTRSWEDSLAASQAGECLALSFLNSTPERERWLIFSAPLLSDPNVIITREEHPFVSDIGALRGKSIALPRGTAMAERIARDYPNLTIIATDSEREALALVSERKADMTLRSLIVAAATIKHEGWFNLKVSGQIPGYDNRLSMGVLKSETLLRDILDKGIATISAQERRQIVDRHVNMTVVTEVLTDHTLTLWLGIVLAAILTACLAWMAHLRRVNDQLKQQAQTDPLTALPNRNALAASFVQEIQSAQRYGRPLSLIILDIDLFKSINDQLGHLMGDRVLVDFARLLMDGLRSVDSVCRWGGEEFLLICRETSLDQAAQLAERVLQRVREHPFPCQRVLTASAGVAAALPGDTLASLMQRADEALYAAKHSGRDRVCLQRAATTDVD